MNSIWQVCATQLEQEIPAQQFRTWIKPLHVVGFDESSHTLRVGVSNRVKLDWVTRTYGARIQQLASAQDPAVRVQFELAQALRARQAEPMLLGAMNGSDPGDAVAEPAEDGVDIADAPTEAPSQATPFSFSAPADAEDDSARHIERSRLNPDLTFATLVKGKANQIAHAASLQVSERPGSSYNPLFLYGGVGLGKTHLVHAVGHALLTRKPRAIVRYIHAEQFVSDVVRAYQRKAFDQFKRYYHSLDLLLIDDIQFFSGREGTQEQFFYAFEALTGARKQIILTSDTYPREMTGFQDRLKSRFDAGLTVQIEPPELEMRVAILIRKAEQLGKTLPENVAFYLAEQLRANVRELEGALNRVIAHSNYYSRPITLELVKEAVRDILSFRRGQVSIEEIQKIVADFYKIKVADMYSKRRPANIALPRQVAMYLAKELTQRSLPEIGESFGGRDHTTVLHAVRKISESRQLNAELNHALHLLEQTLNS